MKVEEILTESPRVLCIVRPRCTFCFTKKSTFTFAKKKYKQSYLLQEDELLRIPGYENNREVLWELLPEK